MPSNAQDGLADGAFRVGSYSQKSTGRIIACLSATRDRHLINDTGPQMDPRHTHATVPAVLVTNRRIGRMQAQRFTSGRHRATQVDRPAAPCGSCNRAFDAGSPVGCTDNFWAQGRTYAGAFSAASASYSCPQLRLSGPLMEVARALRATREARQFSHVLVRRLGGS
ncbi:hypothetical protein MRX96_026976 [Rhipicephalus microplus]